MGIDINSMDDKWKKYAQGADSAEHSEQEKLFKGNDILDLESIFEKSQFVKLAKADGKTEEEISAFLTSQGAEAADINNIFQIDLSNTKAQEHVPNNRSVKRANHASENDIFDGIQREGARYYTNPNKTIKDSVEWQKIADVLVKFYAKDDTGVENKAYYQELSQEVSKVAKIMEENKNYNSRKDIEALYGKVKAEVAKLPKDKFSDFREDIVKDFIVLAERHQKDKEAQKIEFKFKSLRNGLTPEDALKQLSAENPDLGAKYSQFRNSGMSKVDARNKVLEEADAETKNKFATLTAKLTREQAYEKIKSDPEFKGSYYQSHAHIEYADKFMGNPNRIGGYSGLVSQMKDSILLDDARNEVWDAIWAQRGKSNITTSKQVEKEVQKLLGGSADKYTAKVMRGELTFKEKIGWERSVYKDLRKAVAAYNRVENNKLKAFTRDDFYHKAFKGTKGDKNFNRLSLSGPALDKDGNPLLDKDGKPIEYNPVITQRVDANGKPMTDKKGNPLYDLSKVSDIIKKAIAKSNMRADYQKKSSSYAEINNVIGDIKAATCVKDKDGNVIHDGVEISYKDACHLIDMCGFERDKWNVAYVIRAIGNAAVDTISDAAASASAALIVGAVQGDPLVHAIDGQYHAESNIDKITAALLRMSANLGTVDPNNGFSFKLRLNLDVNVDGQNIDMSDSIDTTAIEYSLESALGDLNLPDDAYGVLKDEHGFYLWVNIPSDASYEDIRKMYEILGKNFDLKSDTGVDFENKVVKDKDAEAVVDDKGEAETNKKLEAFLWGTAIGFGLNVLKECLKGLPLEADITNTQVTEKDFASYAQRLSTEPMMKKYPKLQNALLDIARLFEKDGVWQREAYEEFLQEIAGHRSMLNRKELEYGILEWLKTHQSTMTPKKPEDKPAENPTITPVNYDVTQKKEPCNPTVLARTQPHIIKAGDSWDLILDTYYPGIPKEKRIQAKHALKRACGIKLNDTNLKGKLELPAELMGFQRNANMNQEEYDKINNAKRNKNWNNAAWRNGTGIGGRGKAKASKTVDDCTENSPRTIYEGDKDYDKYN